MKLSRVEKNKNNVDVIVDRKRNNSIMNEYREKHKVCEYCGAEAQCVHHIISSCVGGDERESNLISLCFHCHMAAHGKNKVILQKAGVEHAKRQGKVMGRPKAQYPEEWETEYNNWKSGSQTAVDTMKNLGLKKTTFYKLVRMHEGRYKEENISV